MTKRKPERDDFAARLAERICDAVPFMRTDLDHAGIIKGTVQEFVSNTIREAHAAECPLREALEKIRDCSRAELEPFGATCRDIAFAALHADDTPAPSRPPEEK